MIFQMIWENIALDPFGITAQLLCIWNEKRPGKEYFKS